MRVASPSIQAGCRCNSSTWRCASPVTSSVDITRCAIIARSTARRVSSTLPEITRPTSSRSSIMCARWRVWRAAMRARAGGQLAARLDAIEHLDRGRDRAQRVAQLVAEHGQELVLRLVGRLGLQSRRALQLDQRGALTLRLLLVGDVDADADHLLRLAVGVVDHQHAARQPACSAAGQRDPVFQRLALRGRAANMRAQHLLDAQRGRLR